MPIRRAPCEMDAENERAETPLRVKQRSERRRLRSLKRKKTDKASTNSVRTVDVDRPHHDGSPVFGERIGDPLLFWIAWPSLVATQHRPASHFH